MTAPRPLNRTERLDWLRLIRTENVGPVAFRGLLRRFGSAAAALQALPDLARRGGRSGTLRICSAAAAEQELAGLEALGARLIASSEPDYPEALAALSDAPPLISVLGRPELLTRPTVAVVGARNASANGRRLAEDIARDLAAAGWVVVSGFARGIDTAAHKGALGGGTVAVLAGGIDVVYPPENQALYEAIRARGALVAESPLGTEPQARHFPRRNRLISGLSLGVLVVEAAQRSGSLITARFALEQGREVLAVPGSPLDPRCRGTNDLLRNNAVLTESAEDVIRALHDMTSDRLQHRRTAAEAASRDPDGMAEEPIAAAPAQRDTVESLLGTSPVAVDELVRQCHLPAAAVQTILLELELAGRLERQPGNRVSLVSRAALELS